MNDLAVRAQPASDLVTRTREHLADARRQLERIENATLGDKAIILDGLNRMSIALATASAQCAVAARLEPTDEARVVAAELRDQVMGVIAATQQRDALQRALASLRGLDEAQSRVVAIQLRDMRRSGATLAEGDRRRAQLLRREIGELAEQFSRNIRDDRPAVELEPRELDGLPSDYRQRHAPNSTGLVRIPATGSDFSAFMAYATSDAARARLMRAAMTRAPQNLPVLVRLLAQRQELAHTLGYASAAAYDTETEMLDSAARVRAFIAEAFEATREPAARERERLLAAKHRLGDLDPEIYDYELSFLAERVKMDEFAFDARVLRPYLDYRHVKVGLLALCAELFDLSFEPAHATEWDASVETFTVTRDGRAAGWLSLDMFERAGKQAQLASLTYRPGVGGVQLPHVVLVGSLPHVAESDAPLLIDHHELVTLVHEFGHAVHVLARGDIPWLELGEPLESDFLEVPSKLFEEWAWDPQVLRRLTRHVETGAPMPDELVAALRDARHFGRATALQRQLFLAAVALRYHERAPDADESTRLYFELAARYAPARIHPDTRPQTTFEHLAPYGAMYVTYVTGLVVARDLLRGFGANLLDPVAARRYRDLLLAPGGSRPATTLISEFLGRPWNFDAFRAWLTSAR